MKKQQSAKHQKLHENMLPKEKNSNRWYFLLWIFDWTMLQIVSITFNLVKYVKTGPNNIYVVMQANSMIFTTFHSHFASFGIACTSWNESHIQQKLYFVCIHISCTIVYFIFHVWMYDCSQWCMNWVLHCKIWTCHVYHAYRYFSIIFKFRKSILNRLIYQSTNWMKF